MSTTPLRCPGCGEWLRVAVQVSKIIKNEESMIVQFDNQAVAHICKKENK